MLQANSIAIIAALALAAVGSAVGSGRRAPRRLWVLRFGPLVGVAVLIGLGGWRLIFLVNVPISLVGVVTAWLFVPRSRDLAEHEPFDWIGLSLLVPALLASAARLVVRKRAWLDEYRRSRAGGDRWGCRASTFGLRELEDAIPVDPSRLVSPAADSPSVPARVSCSFLVLFGVLFVAPFYLERSLWILSALMRRSSS